MGDVEQASQSGNEGYRLLAESPQDSFHGTGLSEFHSYALLAAGFVSEAADSSPNGTIEPMPTCPAIPARWRSGALGMTELAEVTLQRPDAI